MILSRRVALGGIQLDELDESIVIRSVDTGVPHETLSAVNRMGGAGQRMTTQHWETLDVSVRWAMDIPKTDMARRRDVFEAVTAWALKAGWLTVSYMADRRMYVDKVILPGSGNLWSWTDEFTITFRAYNVPFWQDTLPVTTQGNVASGRMYIDVRGHAQTVLDVEIRNISGIMIPNLSISAGANTLTFTGVNLGGNATLKIHHGTDGLLRAVIGNTSVYDKISGADDLYANPGTVAVDFVAPRLCRVTLQCYGRYC